MQQRPKLTELTGACSDGAEQGQPGEESAGGSLPTRLPQPRSRAGAAGTSQLSAHAPQGFSPPNQRCQQDQMALGGASACPWWGDWFADDFCFFLSKPSPQRVAAGFVLAERAAHPCTVGRGRAGRGRALLPLFFPPLFSHFFPCIFKNSPCLSHPSFSHSLAPVHSEPANGVCSNSVLLDRGCNFNK